MISKITIDGEYVIYDEVILPKRTEKGVQARALELPDTLFRVVKCTNDPVCNIVGFAYEANACFGGYL